MGICLEGIKIAPSPDWLQKRLVAVGMRPINNIVDVTNYIMLEFGQPLHAFDRNLVNEIIVRRAKNNETMETLDGESRELDSDMLVIADSQKPVAIAGIMGGANSEIKNETNSIIIESANFNFLSIRKTGQKLGLRTESAIRFEKALDPNLCETAIIRAVELIKQFCPQAQVVSNLADEKKFKLNQGSIEVNISWLEERIGKKIGQKEIVNILSKLGFVCEIEKDKIKVIVPTWRSGRDVSLPEDIVEEVARIYGYNNIEPVMPQISMEAPLIVEQLFFKEKIKQILSGSARATEVYNYSFVGEKQLKKLKMDIAGHVRLANPITSQQTLMRRSLAPNIFENIKTNQARFDNFCLYEIGNVFFDSPGDTDKDSSGKQKLPFQEDYLAIAYAGNGSKGAGFNKLKSIVSHLFDSLGLAGTYSKAEAALGWAEAGTVASVVVGNKAVGHIAGMSQHVALANSIKKDAAIAEINLGELFDVFQNKKAVKYCDIPKYPPVIRDLAFVVDEEILYNDIKEAILQVSDLISKVDLFDIYVSEKLGVGKKNLAFNIIYQADRTLTSEEVDGIQSKIVDRLKKKYDAQLRNF
jgi:phenylalanyl-tRNA synthetase beta chain